MRRKREAWPQLVARWETSGESAAKFGSRVGTGAATLYRWRRELRRMTVARAPDLAVAKLVEVQPLVHKLDDRFEVRLADGRSVGVPPSFDADALGRLLRVLERRDDPVGGAHLRVHGAGRHAVRVRPPGTGGARARPAVPPRRSPS